MDDSLEVMIARYNAGEPIPAAAPEDLRAALAFFAELQSMPAAPAGAATPTEQPGFYIQDLAAKCSAGSDPLVVALRVALLETVLPLYRNSPHPQGSLTEEDVVEAVARMPLRASDLQDPAVVLERIGKPSGA